MNASILRLLMVALAGAVVSCAEAPEAQTDAPSYSFPAFFSEAPGSSANPLGAPAAAYFCDAFDLPDPADLPEDALRFAGWERGLSGGQMLWRPLSVHRDELNSSFYPDIPSKSEYETQAEYRERLADAVTAWNARWGEQLSVVAGPVFVREWEARPLWNETWGKFGLTYDAEQGQLIHDVYPIVQDRTEHTFWPEGLPGQTVGLRFINDRTIARAPVRYAIAPEAARVARSNIVLVLHGRIAIDPTDVFGRQEALEFRPMGRNSETSRIPFRVEAADIRNICTGEVYATAAY